MNKAMANSPQKLVIVGAGASGLCAAWYGQKAGLSPLILEQSDAVGGAWQKMPNDLTCLSPAQYDRLPNGRSPDSAEDYAKAPEVLQALQEFYQEMSVDVSLNTRVTSVEPQAEHLVIRTESEEMHSERLIVASGIYGKPFIPDLEGSYKGRSIHSSALDPETIEKGSQVLLVGSGNSATEALERLLKHKIQVTLSARSPILPPHTVHYDGLLGRLRYLASGIPIRWVPGGAGCRDHTPVVRPTLFQAIQEEKIALVDAVSGLFDEGAITSSGQRIYAETIIWATGFKRDLDWLGSTLERDAHGIPKHKEGISLNDPRIGFLGIPCQRSRRSGFLRGFADDAKRVVQSLK